MKKFFTLAAGLVFLLCLSAAITGCGDSGSSSKSGSVTGITLTYNGAAIPAEGLTADFEDGSLTFAVNVKTTGGASRKFTLESSAPWVAAASGGTVTLFSAGETTITAFASADSRKKTAPFKLKVLDDNTYTITVNGGSAGVGSSLSGETITLTAGSEAGKVFTGWSLDPPAAVLTSANKFRMPSADVTVTAQFEDANDGAAPYHITNNYAQDSSTAFMVQWHNSTSITEQTLQVTTATGSFSEARNITVTGTLFNPPALIGAYDARNVFRTTVTGLSPNTFYKYRVGAVGGAWSPVFYHRTSAGRGDFSFTVAADPQSAAHTQMASTLRAANSYDPDHRFFLMCGDIVNEIGSRPAEIVSYTNTANEFNIDRPIAATQGNHDTYNTQGDNQYRFGEATVFNAFVTFPDNGEKTGEYAEHNGPNRSKSYYFYYNDVLIIMLNSFVTHRATDSTGTIAPDYTKQAVWLQEVLENDRKKSLSKYKIIASHVPLFGGRANDSWLTGEQRAAFGKICTDYGVDIFFSGHEHVYTRSDPIRLTQNTSPSSINFSIKTIGAVYSIVGATGPKFYQIPASDIWIPRFYPTRVFQADNSPNGYYVNVKVTDEKLIVTAMQVNNPTPIDTYEVPVK